MTNQIVATQTNHITAPSQGYKASHPHTSAFPLAPIPSMQAQCLNAQTHDVWVYFAGSTALKSFLQALGITAFKIGSTARRDLDDRIKDLRRQSYAGKLGVPGDPTAPAIKLEKNDEWFQSPILHEYLGDATLPRCVVIENNALRVTIPRSVSHARFDEALRDLLAARSLNDYLGTLEGRRRMSAAGYKPEHRLITDYALIGSVRRSIATELYLIRVRRELPELIKAVAALIEQM